MSTASVFSFFHFLVLYIQHKHLVISRLSICCFLKLNHLPLSPPFLTQKQGVLGFECTLEEVDLEDVTNSQINTIKSCTSEDPGVKPKQPAFSIIFSLAAV